MKRWLSVSLAVGLAMSIAGPAVADEEEPAEEPRVQIVEEPREKDEPADEPAEALAPAPVIGGTFSTQGGEIVPRSQYAGTVGIGYPALRGMVHIPVLADFEVAPTFSFFYARDTVIVAGDVLSVLLKYRVYQDGKLHISLAADPGVFLSYYKAFTVAINLGLPQLLMTYNLIPEVDLHFGFKMPIAIGVYPNAGAWIPILVNFGAEYHFNDWINIFGSMDMGVDLEVAKGGAVTAFFSPNFIFGAAFKF